MHSFTTVLITASALLATVSSSPLQLRSTCGGAPTGNGSQQPLSQPSGITTAKACQANCTANASCQSFVFGMVNNAVKCILYSVPAASVPKQSSSNLIAYDKSCGSVTAVVPTASNPTGAKTGGKLAIRATCGSAPTGPTGNAKPLSQPSDITTAKACQAKCTANASCQSVVFGMVNNAVKCILYSVPAASVPKQSSSNLIAYDKSCGSVPAIVPTASNPTGAKTGGKLAIRATCGSAPTGPTGNAKPLSQPSDITTAKACQAKCTANASCQSVVFGMVNNAVKCILYSVPAASVPKQSSSNLIAYDKSCGSVPAIVPTASNPTGAKTGGKLAIRATCGSAPTGPTGNTTPISTPANISGAATCKTQCQANPSCKS
ncbi:hypothetical protein V501_01494 [Pseudogymnoascus sp. VKM F-4519 (FW-2642)]|nr:hypothetical protein V501_01494 [Pseudogymnoascus sp. VKM F-4519 (FW-2642)]